MPMKGGGRSCRSFCSMPQGKSVDSNRQKRKRVEGLAEVTRYDTVCPVWHNLTSLASSSALMIIGET